VTLTSRFQLDPKARVDEAISFENRRPEAETAISDPRILPLVRDFEDDDLIVIDKPLAWCAIRPPARHLGTLVNALLAHCGNACPAVGPAETSR